MTVVGWEHIVVIGLAVWTLFRELRWSRIVSSVARERREAEVAREALAECQRLADENPNWERRFWEQFHAIEGILEERNRAYSMYRKSTLLAGNAQDMFMRELQRALALLNERRKRDGEEPLQTQPSLRAAYDEFMAERDAAAKAEPTATISREAPPSLPAAE